MNWNEYFAMMEDWKQLPAYRAEPRIDSFIGFYLPDMLADFCGEKMTGIIPELPIRLGTVKPHLNEESYADKSYKVDFYLLGESGMHYFVEFKTDSGSRRDAQDTYLDEAKQAGMASVVKGILRIASVSSYKRKYGHLRGKLLGLGLIDRDGMFIGKTDTIEIVYVQPQRKDGDKSRVFDFMCVSKWLTERFGQSEFETALAKALAHWATD
jgi:hypothetical protein